jgi:hypothetical protein
MEIGDKITYVDPYGMEHNALVTTTFQSGHPGDGTDDHSVNLIYVSSDSSKSDPYGRQVERSTSVVHERHQAAHGNYWKP